MKLKQELEIFFTAVMFYTRIPVPRISYSQFYLDQSTRYFPLIGWIIGGFAAGIFYFFSNILPVSISLLLSMIGSILLTGAFHEDGFADACDGFGGGMSKDKVLEIMKDSRIGTYGTIGLIFILTLKFLTLLEIPASSIPLVLYIGHSISRFAVNIFRYTHFYVKDDEQSKARPMAEKISLQNLLISAIFGVVPILLLGWKGLGLLVIIVLAEQCTARYFSRRIGGFTGDCLGAMQQICETIFYLSLLGLWKFI